MLYQFNPIGIIHSPCKQKYGIPRQPGLVPQLRVSLELIPPYNCPEAVVGLDGYSHIWIQFVFHQIPRGEWQPMVRPPRLGGNRKVGVFASRSHFRPNPIGLSVVKLESVQVLNATVILSLSGADLLDGTPVLDIKPYIGYVECIGNTRSGFAQEPLEPPKKQFRVEFTPLARNQIQQHQNAAELFELIRALLEIDPRPAYMMRDQPGRIHGMLLYDFDLRWKVQDAETILVLELVSIP